MPMPGTNMPVLVPTQLCCLVIARADLHLWLSRFLLPRPANVSGCYVAKAAHDVLWMNKATGSAFPVL